MQNTALRIVTGFHAITPEDHLHQETKVLPVKNHCTLLTRQHLIKCERPDHPNHFGTRPLSTGRPRPVRSDIRRERNAVSHLTNLVLDGKVKDALNSLHTDAVSDAIEHFKLNVVLGGRPPPIHASESTLTRPERTSLSQLRSGYSKYLNTYLARVNGDVPLNCPLCDTAPHTTKHLFECPQRPTGLTPLSLWTNPVEASRFLALDRVV